MQRRLLLAALLATLTTACNRGKVSLEGDEDADAIDELCDDNKDFLQDQTVEIVFEAVTDDCPWGEGDNLDIEDTYLTARIEQSEALDIDDEVLLCDLEFDLTGLVPGEVQLLHYDDYFFFTFNDVVMASSHAVAVMDLETDDDLPIYDWADIVGAPFPNGDAPFCLGESAGDGACEIPSTDTTGPISLEFRSAVTNALSARALAEERFDFGFVTTGDNDPGTDCMHDEFGFTVDVEYLDAG